jgi:hypothetical protein
MVTDNIPNRNNVNIHASIYSQNGGFGAENYNTRPISGNINLLGGITQSIRRAVGTFSSSSGVTAGFSKNNVLIDRLRIAAPPFIQQTVHFKVDMVRNNYFRMAASLSQKYLHNFVT